MNNEIVFDHFMLSLVSNLCYVIQIQLLKFTVSSLSVPRKWTPIPDIQEDLSYSPPSFQRSLRSAQTSAPRSGQTIISSMIGLPVWEYPALSSWLCDPNAVWQVRHSTA